MICELCEEVLNVVGEFRQVHDLGDSCSRKVFFASELRLSQSGVLLQLSIPLKREMNRMFDGFGDFIFIVDMMLQLFYASGWVGDGEGDERTSAPSGKRNSDDQRDVPKSSYFAQTRGANFIPARDRLLQHLLPELVA